MTCSGISLEVSVVYEDFMVAKIYLSMMIFYDSKNTLFYDEILKIHYSMMIYGSKNIYFYNLMVAKIP